MVFQGILKGNRNSWGLPVTYSFCVVQKNRGSWGPAILLNGLWLPFLGAFKGNPKGRSQFLGHPGWGGFRAGHFLASMCLPSATEAEQLQVGREPLGLVNFDRSPRSLNVQSQTTTIWKQHVGSCLLRRFCEPHRLNGSLPLKWNTEAKAGQFKVGAARG